MVNSWMIASWWLARARTAFCLAKSFLAAASAWRVSSAPGIDDLSCMPPLLTSPYSDHRWGNLSKYSTYDKKIALRGDYFSPPRGMTFERFQSMILINDQDQSLTTSIHSLFTISTFFQAGE
jgi:hypothetical protein